MEQYCVVLRIEGWRTEIYGPYESRKKARDAQYELVGCAKKLGFIRDRIHSEVKELYSSK